MRCSHYRTRKKFRSMKVAYNRRETGFALGVKIHVCSACGDPFIWNNESRWFGSYADLDEGREIKKYCSRKCVEKNEETNT